MLKDRVRKDGQGRMKFYIETWGCQNGVPIREPEGEREDVPGRHIRSGGSQVHRHPQGRKMDQAMSGRMVKAG
jgi:hypothetical protein